MPFARYIVIACGALLLSGCSALTPTIQAPPTVEIPAGKFYFSSSTCPHCAVVKAYIDQNDTRQKLYFIERQIDTDASSVALLTAMGSRCGLSPSELAVPFFWDSGRCYMGQEEVISYFESL